MRLWARRPLQACLFRKAPSFLQRTTWCANDSCSSLPRILLHAFRSIVLHAICTVITRFCRFGCPDHASHCNNSITSLASPCCSLVAWRAQLSIPGTSVTIDLILISGLPAVQHAQSKQKFDSIGINLLCPADLRRGMHGRAVAIPRYHCPH